MGRTVVLVAIVQQLLPLPLILLGAPQLPCSDNEPRVSAMTVWQRETLWCIWSTVQYGAEFGPGGPTLKIPTGLLWLLVFFNSLLHGFPLLLESFT